MIRGLVLLACLSGSSGCWLGPDARDASSVDEKLSKCRTEARADYYVGQRSVEESLKAYEDCKKREGL